MGIDDAPSPLMNQHRFPFPSKGNGTELDAPEFSPGKPDLPRSHGVVLGRASSPRSTGEHGKSEKEVGFWWIASV